jgi:hypothetical protein
VLIDGTLGKQLLQVSAVSPLFRTFVLSHPPSCFGLIILRLFSPNIWRPPWFKLEEYPHNATKMSQPTSPSGRRLTSNHQPKHFSPTTHSSAPYHHRNLRTPNKHVHHSRLQPQWLRGQLHPNPRSCPTPVTPKGTFTTT